MSKRYGNRSTFENRDEMYDELLEKRGVEFIDHYTAFEFNRKITRKSYVIQEHTWTKGDRLYKIAGRFYGSIEFWWIIALWNGKPTDANFILGEVIQVPFPPMQIYRELIS